MSTFYISNSSTAIRPIRCFLCIMHMQWSSKGLPMRRLSFRNESEGGGGHLELNTRGESLQK